MSLYYEAASFLSPASSREGSLKSRIFKAASHLKSNPATIYALLSETAKYDALLTEVIDNAGILALESKLTPSLSLLLVHDHLLSKKGIAATTNHPFRLAIERHKARLQAELTKCRLRRGCASIEDLKKHIAQRRKKTFHEDRQPRWVRVNYLKSTVPQQMCSTFSDHTQVSNLADVIGALPGEKVVYLDQHIPGLLAIPYGIEVTKTKAYKNGELIIQDKASCFPAYLLLDESGHHNGCDILDACAAPGNKTTHLASIVSCQSIWTDSAGADSGPKIFACERDPLRSETLRKMVALVGAERMVTVLAKQDFLALDPADPSFKNVTHLLLDPSCSGSGIVGRDDVPVLQLPKDPKVRGTDQSAAKGKASSGITSKKRKRNGKLGSNFVSPSRGMGSSEQSNELEMEETREIDFARLEKLATLQTKIIEHALSFPAARCITYSTCSVHVQENEAVVARALSSEIAIQRGWRIMRRDEQPDGICRWPCRGFDLRDQGDGQPGPAQRAVPHILSEEQKEACVRCQAGDEEGTMGFFVCGFIRDSGETEVNKAERIVEPRISHEDEEWGGFSDDESS